jgi:hypothetical protein
MARQAANKPFTAETSVVRKNQNITAEPQRTAEGRREKPSHSMAYSMPVCHQKSRRTASIFSHDRRDAQRTQRKTPTLE